MLDLTTTYLGLKLKNPLVPSPSPLMEKVDNIRRMEDNGAAAVVSIRCLKSRIIREGESLDRYLDQGAESFWEACSIFRT